METQKLTIDLLSKRQDVLPYVAQVVEAAETVRDALGWFPFKVYNEAATGERLIVRLLAKLMRHVMRGTFCLLRGFRGATSCRSMSIRGAAATTSQRQCSTRSRHI